MKNQPYRFTVIGGSLAEIHEKIIAAANELGTTESKISVGVTGFDLPKTEVASSVRGLSEAELAFKNGKAGIEEAVQEHNLRNGNESRTTVVHQSSGVDSAYAGVTIDENALDSKGIPWDSRIHSTTKEKNKDGTYRKKRGIDDQYYRQIIDEHTGKRVSLANYHPIVQSVSVGNREPVAIAATPAPILVPPVPAFVPSVQTPQMTPVPTGPVEPVQSVPAQSPPAAKAYENVPVPQGTTQKPAHTFSTFKANFIETIMQLVNQGKIDQKYIQDLIAHFQKDDPKIKELHNFYGSEKAMLAIYNSFVEHGLITKLDN